jgi:hypothetical protein
MKLRPSLLLAVVFIVLFAMASCVKSYTCHCDIKYSGMPGLPDSTTQEYTIKDVKAAAKSKCSNESGVFDNNGIHTVESCYLY